MSGWFRQRSEETDKPDFGIDGLGDFGRRNPRDVMGQICPESHSSSSREVRRKHRKRTEEF